MTSVIREYEVLRERGKSVLRSLFKAGDVDGDGKLTLKVHTPASGRVVQQPSPPFVPCGTHMIRTCVLTVCTFVSVV
jgi:hypothetical protein